MLILRCTWHIHVYDQYRPSSYKYVHGTYLYIHMMQSLFIGRVGDGTVPLAIVLLIDRSFIDSCKAYLYQCA